MRKYMRPVALIEDTVGEPMRFESLKDAAQYLYDSDMSPNKPTAISIYTALVYAVKRNNRYKNYAIRFYNLPTQPVPVPKPKAAPMLPMSTGGTQVHNTNLDGYSEPDALQMLIRSVDAALKADLVRTEKFNNFTTDQILISVGGTTCAFYLGGPQAEALYTFAKQICDENLYVIDFDNLTVEGW